MSKLSSSISSTIRAVRNGPQVPPWWPLLQAALVAVLVVLVAWSYMSSSGQPGTPGGSANSSQTPGSVAGPDATDPTTSEESPGEEPSEPATVEMPMLDGTRAQVPTEARDLAMAAYEALSDPELAAQIPMADGETFPAPAKKSKATIKDVAVDSFEEDRIRFSAFFDPDAGGPLGATPMPWTVLVNESGYWVLTQQD